MITGIYSIKNIVNDKVYVGSATDIKKRWRDHKWYLNHNKHHNSHLQSSWNKYGCDAFEFSILHECGVNELLMKETEYIQIHKSKDNSCGYNVNDPKQIFLNRVCPQETKNIQSNRMSGKNNPMYGKFGKEHPKFKMKMSEKNKKIVSDKAKKRVGNNSNAHKLNECDVIEIRCKYRDKIYNQTELSKIYCVTQATISDIIIRKSWSHI
jgi:group I intron endonuclease